MELGQKFKQIRKQRKYTIQRLAQVAGSVASISDFENNKTSLSNDILFKLLKHLKVEYNEFFGQEYLVDETYIKLANQYNQASNNLDFEALKQVAERFRILGETLGVPPQHLMATISGNNKAMCKILVMAKALEKWNEVYGRTA